MSGMNRRQYANQPEDEPRTRQSAMMSPRRSRAARAAARSAQRSPSGAPRPSRPSIRAQADPMDVADMGFQTPPLTPTRHGGGQPQLEAGDEVQEPEYNEELDRTDGPLKVELRMEYKALPQNRQMEVFAVVKLKQPNKDQDKKKSAGKKRSIEDGPVPAAAAAAATGTNNSTTDEELPEEEGGIEGVAMDLVCVLDISGSMYGPKLDSVREIMKYIIQHDMKDTDRLGIVMFDSFAEVLLPLKKMTPENKSAAMVKVMRLASRGGTNIYSGVDLAVSMLEQRSTKNFVSSIFMLTDGQDHTSPQQVQSLSRRSMMMGTSFYPFGIGSDHNQNIMSIFAEGHSTTYTTIDNVDNLSEQLVAPFHNVRGTTLKDIELKLKATDRDNTLIKSLHIDYPNEISRDKKSATITIPDLLKAEDRNLLIELEVPEVSFSTDKSTRILSVSGNYRDMEALVRRRFIPKHLSLTRIVEAEPDAEDDEGEGEGEGEKGKPKKPADEEVVRERQKREVRNVFQQLATEMDGMPSANRIDALVDSSVNRIHALSMTSPSPAIKRVTQQMQEQLRQTQEQSRRAINNRQSRQYSQHLTSVTSALRTSRPTSSRQELASVGLCMSPQSIRGINRYSRLSGGPVSTPNFNRGTGGAPASSAAAAAAAGGSGAGASSAAAAAADAALMPPPPVPEDMHKSKKPRRE